MSIGEVIAAVSLRYFFRTRTAIFDRGADLPPRGGRVGHQATEAEPHHAGLPKLPSNERAVAMQLATSRTPASKSNRA
jgi:hypothetical protein